LNVKGGGSGTIDNRVNDDFTVSTMEALLARDFGDVQNDPKLKTAKPKLKDSSFFTWVFSAPGGKGTSWEGLVYDVEIRFSRRHPFEPPVVSFPRTRRNVANPGHPDVDMTGRLRLQKLSFDKWFPTVKASTVVGWVFQLFETEPPSITSGSSCPFTSLSSQCITQVLGFLDAGNLCRMSTTGKHMLSLCFEESIWANLYYQCGIFPASLLGQGGPKGGCYPLRVMSLTGKWFWKGAREVFIRAHEMKRAFSGKHCAPYLTQEAFASREINSLMLSASRLLADIHR
ncbi:unnamed protein product, partial [Choristocarpus tenellus]